ncbi:MAG: hypothetical protein HOV83_40795 [Catenulispora sp.]|nr:hypothetical protein [Catenulispora sp.]
MNASPESLGSLPARLRPDLPIPLAPDGRVAALVRTALTRLETPTFAEARRFTLRAAAILVGAVVVGRFTLVAAVRPWIYSGATLILAALAVRAVALGLAEQRQRGFQEQWLRTRTAALRRTSFEIIRFTVVPSRTAGATTVWDAVGYDLTKYSDVGALLERREAERRAGLVSRVMIEFCHPTGTGAATLVEEVWADLGALDLRTTAARLLHAGAVFPDARYHARPAVGRWGRDWPARETFWTLGAPVVTAVRPDR